MATPAVPASAEIALSKEKLRLLEHYYQHREQEDALREARIQFAARLRQIDGELSGREAARGEAVATDKKGEG